MTELDRILSEQKARSTGPTRSRIVEEPDFSDRLGKLLLPYSHSPWPAWSLSGLFMGTSMLGLSNPALPPFALRFGFGLIFAGAGYIVSTGDVENGSGVASSWTGSYFVINALRKEFRKMKGAVVPEVRPWQRPPLVLALNGATFLTMALYGAEYFWFQNFRPKPRY
ncbi:hypothetical protein M422DRAFT_23339 [Sphaerobolus stellatus SS14]|nr:hypothetical protein M422DRAFT_23339 [Sphaerobolus stellatus SS14]